MDELVRERSHEGRKPSHEVRGALKALRQPGRWLVAVLILGILADLAATGADAVSLSVLERLRDGEDVPVDTVTDSDNAIAATAAAQFLVAVVSAIVFIVWFRRGYSNVPRISSGPQRWGTGWAIGAWFVPLLNLVRPKAMANDIWRAGERSPAPGVPFADRRVAGIVHLWWAGWIVTSVLGNLAARLFFQAETLDAQRNSTSLTLFSDALDAVVGVIAVILVVRMTRRHDARLADQQSDGSAVSGDGEDQRRDEPYASSGLRPDPGVSPAGPEARAASAPRGTPDRP